jgi:hypothetical protein
MQNPEWTPSVWADEVALIKIWAAKYNLDWHFVAAIRKAEDGGPGKEFGVLSEKAPNFTDQCRIACITLRHRLFEYSAQAAVFDLHEAPDEEKVLVYSPRFVTWFSKIWAPQGAANDPDHLNNNWARNASYWYLRLIDLEHPATQK